MRKKIIIIPILLAVASSSAFAREWTLDDCMDFAADNSTDVDLARWDLSTANAESTQAFAEFLPSLSAQVGAQFSWGRNIDPETNTYNNVTTFNNGYGVYASLTLFDGGRTFNRYKQARAQRSRTLNAVRMRRDDAAIAAMMAYADVVYYNRSITIAEDKLEQSRAVLRLTQAQEQLGTKGLPDLAQAEATVADNEYQLINQRNQYANALLKLRSVMNFPSEEDLTVRTADVLVDPALSTDNIDDIYRYALTTNPTALDAELTVKESLYQYRVAKGTLMPSISLNAGISTSYYKTLTGGYEGPGFNEQFRNNRGEYVSASLSIPLFDNLSGSTSLKRARNQLAKSRTQRAELQRKLRDEIACAVMDRDGYALEIVALETKVEADNQAYMLNRRKYEEGLLSLIDLQLSANAYFTSQLNLLQKQMLYMLKDRLVDYYKGIPLTSQK